MQKILELGDTFYYRFMRPEDLGRFKVSRFDFFRGFGIIDYQETFKAWLRKFPRPVFIAATKGKNIQAWVYIDEWKEGVSSDGNSVFVLRAIETTPPLRRRRIGTRLVALGLKNTVGYMIVKPVSDRAKIFFRRNGFRPPEEIENLTVDLSKHPGYFVLTLPAKKKTLEMFNSTAVIQPIFVENSRTGVSEQIYDNDPVAYGTNTTPDISVEPSMFVYYNPSHATHASASASPEKPSRIDNIFNFLKKDVNLFKKNIVRSENGYRLSRKELMRTHTRRYVEFVEAYSKKGGGFLGDDTYITSTTFEVARMVAGGAVECARRVADGEFSFSFALIRPPGHHASRDKHGGFCIFNNSAVATRYLLDSNKASRVMILDWDAHAANGTQEIFYSDPNVLLVSIHQSPKDFYPHTGFSKQLGRGEGLGYNVNIEMPKGAGDDEYRLVLSEVVKPLISSYKPDMIIGCCGFDAYYRDKHTGLNLTARGYYDIATFLRKEAAGRAAIIMEGGYHDHCDKLTYTFINGILGRRLPYIESVDPLLLSAVSEEKVRKKLLTSIKELKMRLAEHHEL